MASRRPACRPGAPGGAIQLNSNENPYGPSRRALEAMKRLGGAGSRYPAGREDDARDAIAKLHGVAPTCVTLSCGSGEMKTFLAALRQIVPAAVTST